MIEYRDNLTRLLNAEDWEYIMMALGLADKYLGDIDGQQFGIPESKINADPWRYYLYNICGEAKDIGDKIYYSKEIEALIYSNVIIDVLI